MQLVSHKCCYTSCRNYTWRLPKVQTNSTLDKDCCNLSCSNLSNCMFVYWHGASPISFVQLSWRYHKRSCRGHTLYRVSCLIASFLKISVNLPDLHISGKHSMFFQNRSSYRSSRVVDGHHVYQSSFIYKPLAPSHAHLIEKMSNLNQLWSFIWSWVEWYFNQLH
jgi:hypothetical protein